jgi:hypothetical protein
LEAAIVRNGRSELMIALALIAVGVSLRILPHPANFAPITAIAIFGGAVLPRKFAVWVPVGAMMISDAVIGFYSMMPVTWACYALIALASSLWLSGRLRFIRAAVLTLSASIFFFVVTNFAVWLTSGMYTHTVQGFWQCYIMALPFFRNTVLSDACYTAALFMAYALARCGTLKVSGRMLRSRAHG